MRLRAGRALFGHELVDFRLPRIVQYEDDAVLQALRNLPFCQTEPLDWQGQFRFKFILSIDGNGAACSRNAIVLRSRSVLLKFESRHSLFYFHGLQPWVHFIPIEAPEDVPKLVEMLAMEPELCAAIAEAGQVFASRYLTRAALLDYTTHLLELLPSCFAEEFAPDSPVVRPQDSVPYPGLVCRAHIEWRGDVESGEDSWVGEPGSRKWIEGLCIEAPPALGLAYAVLDAAGLRSPTQRAGTFVGSRGEFAPLLGLAVHSAVLDLALETSFVDGTRVANAPSGAMHRAPSGAPLEAFRLIRREAD